jgi:hypothetical protein
MGFLFASGAPRWPATEREPTDNSLARCAIGISQCRIACHTRRGWMARGAWRIDYNELHREIAAFRPVPCLALRKHRARVAEETFLPDVMGAIVTMK